MAKNDIIIVRDKFLESSNEFEENILNLKQGSIIYGSEEDVDGNVIPALLESDTFTAGYVLALDSDLIPTWVAPSVGGGAVTNVPGTDEKTFILDYDASTAAEKASIIWTYGSSLIELKDNATPTPNYLNFKVKTLTLTGTTFTAPSAAATFASVVTSGVVTASGVATFNSTLTSYGNTTVAYNGGAFLSKASTFRHENLLIELNTRVDARPDDSTGIKAYYEGGYTSLTHEYLTVFGTEPAASYHGWLSNENITLSTGKSFYIGNVSVLSGTTLGGAVLNSSLTKVGTVTTGTWNGTKIATNYGGTGLNESNTSGNSLGDILCLNGKTTPYTYGFRSLTSVNDTISIDKSGTTTIGLTVNTANVLDYKAKICATGVTEDYLFGKGDGSSNDGLIIPSTGGGIGITKNGSQMELSLKYDTLAVADNETLIYSDTLALYQGGITPFQSITAQNFFCSLTANPAYSAPANDAAGTKGQIIITNDYLYACTTTGSAGSGEWKRIILSTY